MRLSFSIPEKPPSWNQFWAGGHWTKRQAFKEKWRTLTMVALKKYGLTDKGLLQRPVNIIIEAASVHPLDTSNVCIKPIEDTLIGVLLQDDNPKWVRSMHVTSLKVRSKKYECVNVTLEVL